MFVVNKFEKGLRIMSALARLCVEVAITAPGYVFGKVIIRYLHQMRSQRSAQFLNDFLLWLLFFGASSLDLCSRTNLRNHPLLHLLNIYRVCMQLERCPYLGTVQSIVVSKHISIGNNNSGHWRPSQPTDMNMFPPKPHISSHIFCYDSSVGIWPLVITLRKYTYASKP